MPSDDATTNAREAEHQKVTDVVRTTVDHLRNNRTTETEAQDLKNAAERSLVDHATHRALRNN